MNGAQITAHGLLLLLTGVLIGRAILDVIKWGLRFEPGKGLLVIAVVGFWATYFMIIGAGQRSTTVTVTEGAPARVTDDRTVEAADPSVLGLPPIEHPVKLLPFPADGGR